MGNYYAYMRISTREEREKQTYLRQENALNRYAEKRGIEYILKLKEDVSGKSFINRTEWKRLEKLIQPGDTIIFKDICRFTREAENGYKKYMELMQKGVNLFFLDNPTVSTEYIKELLEVAEKQDRVASESTKFIAKILLIVELDRAEKERQFISQRTKDGLAARKAEAEERGEMFHSGRAVGKLDKMTEELKADIESYLADRSIKAVDLMKKHGISRNTLKKYVEIVKGKG